MAVIKRGKALVAALRAQPNVRDAEALAAWLGRRKKARKAAKAVADKAKGNGGGKKSVFAPKVEDDDPFADPFAEDDEPKSKEEQQQERYEQRLLRQAEKEERSRLYSTILDAGGLQTRSELREEYSEIPNTYKRRDGMPGDEMAEYLAYYYPEYGIQSERDLIDFLVAV